MTVRDLFTAASKLLLRAGWAPILVLIIHKVVAGTPWRQALDFWMHFSGGLAIAYFLYRAIQAFPRILRTASRFGDYLFAFALAAVVGLFWEFAELASDHFLHTHIQISIWETMRDLIADCTGATVALTLIVIAGRIAGARPSTPAAPSTPSSTPETLARNPGAGSPSIHR